MKNDPKLQENALRNALAKLLKNRELTKDEAFSATLATTNLSNANDSLIAAYLTALSMKGATSDEIVGTALAIRSCAPTIPFEGDLFDFVGTGGDGANVFNVSTASAFVVASVGVKTAKHGNRAASSKCGAADCLEALGARLDATPERCADLLQTLGFCFVFAPKFHSATIRVAKIRRELGFHTVFNYVGPLTNPCRVKRSIVGVCEESLLTPIRAAAQSLGVERGAVVFGGDILDEISSSAPTLVCEFDRTSERRFEISPETFGFPRRDRSEILGGTPKENAAILRAVLEGRERGAKREIVLINAGFGLYVAGKVSDPRKGGELAARLIDSGAAVKKLNDFIRRSNE